MNSYSVSLDKNRLQLDVIHAFLTTSYWSPGIPRATVERAIANSLCSGAFAADSGAQVAFARLITDHATFGYLADVFVLEGHRGRGLAEHLVRLILAEPDLQGLRRFLLATRDAHRLYAKRGFSPVAKPQVWMEIAPRDVYRKHEEAQAS